MSDFPTGPVPDGPPDDDDLIEGCAVDMADPVYVSTDEQVDALLMFGDLPWTGTTVDADGRTVPTCDPDAVAQRVADLQALAAVGADGIVTVDPAWFGAHGQGEATPGDDMGMGGADA